MRVALVSPYAWAVPGGVNDHVANLAGQLEQRGHEAWIVAPTAPLGKSRGRSGFPERFIPAGLAVPFRSNGSRAYVNVYPHSPWSLRRSLRRRQFDIFHVHEPAVPPTAFLSVFLADAPVVGTFHAAGQSSAGYEMFGGILERLMDNISVRIAVSEAAREFVARYHPGEYRIIPNGVLPGRYASAGSLTKVPGRLIFIGRAEPRKGLHVLLRAFQRLREMRPGASLDLVGTAEEELMRTARRIWPQIRGPIPGVTPLGRVSQEEKVRRLGMSEVAVVPSLEGESFGIVLIECLAAGVPVVASDLPGYRRVLEDGRLGELVSPDDPGALALALERLLADDGRRRRMATLGVREVQQYSWDRVVDQVLAAYEDALVTAPLPLVPRAKVLPPAARAARKSSRRRERIRTS